MNRIKHKSLINQTGFVLPVLVIVIVLAASVFSYFYFRGSDSVKPDINKRVEDKANKKVNKVPLSDIPAEIAITKNGFMPATISVAVGQQVTFVNQDRSAHRVSNTLPDLDSEDLQPTDSFTYSFEKSGTFILSDEISSGKYKATVVVN